MPKDREQMNYDTELVWNFIEQNDIATYEELQLITDINGYGVETLNDVINVRTEYHDVEQIYDCERESYDFEMFDDIEEDFEEDDEEEDEDYDI